MQHNATHTLLIDFFLCLNLALMNETDKLQKEFLMMLGKRIRELRLKKGLSQSELANLCGKERQSYQRVETGNINPTIWYLHHISSALDIDFKEMLDIDFPKVEL